MQDYQKEFLDFVIARQILRFGDFTLKSGRQSPYFFNAGLFNSGDALGFLGTCYAATIRSSMVPFDMLFGPAYKGIPLVSATAIALARQFALDVPYGFNRKEAKDHGEGGSLVGAPLAGKVLIIDDVITAGTAIREVIGLIQAAGADVAGVVVALDREERGQGELSAIGEIREQFGIPVLSIIGLERIIHYLEQEQSAQLAQYLPRLQQYRESYGTARV